MTADLNLLAYLRLIRNSKPIQAAALLTPVDTRKVDYELNGIQKPLPNAAWALGIAGAARIAYQHQDPPAPPPPPPPPPPPSNALAPVWQRDGVFVRRLSNFPGPLRQAARIAGFSWMAVQLDHSPDAEANKQELDDIGTKLRAEGWSICGWATYGQGTNPETDSTRAGDLCRLYGLKGWQANGESWAEGVGRWKSQAFVNFWTSPCPLAVSCNSSDTGNFARDFAYEAWLAVPGAAVCPQAYSQTNPGLTVGAMKANLQKAGVPLARVAPSFEVVGGQGNVADYRLWAGPRSVFAADDSSVAFWQAMTR